jgi:hypothetical protein
MMQMPMVFPLFLQNQDFSSSVVLTNAADQPTYADVILRATTGTEITRQRVEFTAHSQRTVDIQSLLMSAVSPLTTGSITVMQDSQFDGTMVILGQLSMTYRASQQPNYIDEEIAMPSAQGSQTLRAVVDRGEGSPLVAITNVSEAGQHVAIQCLAEKSQSFSKSVDLLAGETLLTEACSEQTTHGATIESFASGNSQGPRGPVGISLTTDSMPGTLAAFGLRRHKDGNNESFSAVAFTDPKMLNSSTTIFAGVPVGAADLLQPGNYVPELSLANFSGKALKVHVQYAETSGAAPTTKEIAALTVPAGTSKSVTFDNLQSDAQLQNSFLVSSEGAPGDLVTKIISRNDSASALVELLAKDAQDSNNGGSNPWSIEQGAESTLLFFNHDQAPQILNVLIESADGSQWNKDFKLASMETMAISIGDIVQKEAEDDKGKTLPKTATAGQISWWTVGTASGPSTGRLLQSDRVSGMARSFACGCPYILCNVDIIQDFDLALLGTTDTPMLTLAPIICLYKTGTHCGGTTTANSSSQALNYSWSSSNSAVAQVSGSSTNSSVNVYGSSIGTATMTGRVSATYYQPAETCTFSPTAPSNVISVRINFTGSKTQGDNLMFSNSQHECSESLGLTYCTPSTGYWLWNLEGNGKVYDDASNWTVALSAQYKYKGYYLDSNNNLQPFSCSASIPNDGPQATFLQQPFGQTSIFYLDGPGLFYGTDPSNQCLAGSSPVDSVKDVLNFQVKFTNNRTSYSRTVYYYVQIVVDPGRILDGFNSTAAYGNVSLNF